MDSGIRALSSLLIDVDKDWAGKRIENLGTPDSDDDALSRGLVDIYSIDYGLKWEDLGVVTTASVLDFAYLGNGIVILREESTHLFRSTDYGLTWTDLGGIASSVLSSVPAYLGNGIVIVGDLNKHVYRSTDYGLTWTDLGAVAIGNIYDMAYLGNGIAILACASNHVYRSIDYGLTWADIGVAATGTIFAMTYLGNGIAILGDDARHVWRSIDYGLTWADLGVVATGGIYAMAYLGNGIALLSDVNAHVYRSTDYGATWTDIATVSGAVNRIAYLANGIVILACDGGHIHRSTDYGLTWADLGAITAGDAIGLAYLDNGIALAGNSTSHVYRSTSAFQLSNFNPNQFDKLLQFGCLGIITPNATSYLAPGNGATQVNEIAVRVTRPGILKNLYVWQRVASSTAGWTDIYTVRVNGVDKAITCTLDNATEGSDTINEVLVAAGNQVSISLVSNNIGDTSEDVVATLELI